MCEGKGCSISSATTLPVITTHTHTRIYIHEQLHACKQVHLSASQRNAAQLSAMQRIQCYSITSLRCQLAMGGADVPLKPENKTKTMANKQMLKADCTHTQSEPCISGQMNAGDYIHMCI